MTIYAIGMTITNNYGHTHVTWRYLSVLGIGIWR